MARRLDIIIFGATGFTGKLVVEKIVAASKERKNLTWGVAGRSRAKLEEILVAAVSKGGSNLNNVKVVVANIANETSMASMAKMCKVLINCVGPYRHYGEQTVKACVENGTHHVDVSGEPEYMEKMQLLFHKEAEKKGIYVVSSCGFDSVPAEIGCLHFMKQFEGDVNSMETFLHFTTQGKQEGAKMNYATWESLVYGMASAKDLGPLRKKLFPQRLPAMTPKLNPRGSIFQNPVGAGWCMPFPGSDLPVMRRSQYYFHEKKGQRPLQIQCYFTIPSLVNVASVTTAGVFLSMLAKYGWGRNLLLAHPRLFTQGFISREGPSEESRKNTVFSVTFSGDGWTDKKPEGIHDSPPDTKVVTRISGSDPAYGMAAVCVLMCALTILDESDKMPGNGGVFPPGAAFHNTSLIPVLQKNGILMEVVEKKPFLRNKL